MKSNSESVVPGASGAQHAWPDTISVTGTHAERFLQAQLTCDLGRAGPGTGLPFAWCTPAGRVRASGWLMRGENTFWLLVGASCGAGCVNSLHKFILRDKVTINANPFALVSALTGDPNSAEADSDLQDATSFQLPGAPPRQIAMPTGSVECVDANAFALAGIRSGVCELPAGMEDRFIPQMLNLDLTGGVSFTKGCYPGQEIIARTHNLGRVKRRTLRYASETQAPPAATAIFSGDKEVGLTLASANAGNGCELLAVMQLDRLDGSALSLGRPAGPLLQPLPLPYAIPEIATQTVAGS